jgi:hypothetical protein
VVCATVEVRSYKELAKLTNCTIVVGNVAVMIGFDGAVENFTKDDIQAQSFPLRYTRTRVHDTSSFFKLSSNINFNFILFFY